ncbi:MAG: CHAT domain-containing protein [Geitlerinemataceae cyanobacterium]
MLKPLIQYLKIWLSPGRIRSPFGWISIGRLLLGIAVSLCLATFPAITQELPIDGRELIQKGIDRYENELFTEAIDLWDRAQQEFIANDDRLGEALALNNLSLAYQHLGQLERAQQTISDSFKKLEQQEDLDDTTYLEILAKASISRGRLYWIQGKPEVALDAWKQAETSYCQAGNGSGVLRSWLNQTQALQALGLIRPAQEQLQQVYLLLQSPSDSQIICQFTDTFDPALRVAGLQSLGQSLRRLGWLERDGDRLGSVEVLQTSLDLAQQFSLDDAKSSIWLELGNTKRALFEKFQAMGKKAEASRYANESEQFYDRAATSGNAEIALQAQLNRLSLGVATGENYSFQNWQQIQQKISQFPPSRQSVYAQLNLAWSLTCSQLANVSSCGNSDLKSPETPNISPTEIAEIIAAAAQNAKSINDSAAESYALGQLGELYEVTGNEATAISLTQQALRRVEGLQFPEIRYRWEWQLGRLLRKKGTIEDAIAAYETAAESLKSVRGDLLTVNADIQFSFRDRVEPLYRQLVELLLPANELSVPQINVQKALYYIEEIQLAELENFLRCSLATLEAMPDANSGNEIDRLMGRIDRLLQNDAALIYPILLSDRVAVLFKLPGNNSLGYYSYPIDKTTAQTTLRTLRTSLLNLSRPEERIAASRQVYQWFSPLFSTDLPQNPNIQTLVFVLDGELRNIPIAALQDNSGRYLVQQDYAIVVFPSSQLFEIAASPRPLQVLGAGITEELTVADRPPFSALTGVEAEVEAVSSVDPLINEEFTQQNLQHWVDTNTFSIVHLATHGNFSSDPEETYLLLHGTDPDKPTGELLKANELDRLLRDRTSRSDRPLDLLVLSACETAEGDNRATLGLAGLAVRAGARSTLATLWQVSDRSTVKLMEQFYSQLQQNPRSTKAQALQTAQNLLLSNPNFDNPFFWAPYILVGNWR